MQKAMWHLSNPGRSEKREGKRPGTTLGGLTGTRSLALIARCSKAPGLPADLTEGQVAQSVEQRTENPRVGSSILPLATNLFKNLRKCRLAANTFCVSFAWVGLARMLRCDVLQNLGQIEKLSEVL